MGFKVIPESLHTNLEAERWAVGLVSVKSSTKMLFRLTQGQRGLGYVNGP